MKKPGKVERITSGFGLLGCRNLEKSIHLSNRRLLGGSGDLVSKVISALIGVISNYKNSYLIYNLAY